MAGVTTRDAKGVPLTADDYDNNLETMISLHQGTSEPSPTYACMLWADTQNTLLKMRNTANDGWVTLGALNTNDAFGGISDLVEDTTPQLGGTLDANGQEIDMGTNTITDTKVGNWDTAYGWGDHSTEGYLTGITGESIESLSDVNTMTPSDGQLLTWDNANSRWDAANAPVSLPDQTDHSGEYLTTDGSTASWAALDTDANSTTKGLYEHANTISANYSITSGNNAMSAGAITIDSGVSVTVPTGSTWTIV
jgi:hypothetical protein